MWPAMWLWSYGRAAVPRASAPELALARLLRSPFTAEQAEQLVRDLPKRQLVRMWNDSTRLLGLELRVDVRLNVVVLRDHLLQRLEGVDPRGAEQCLRTGRPAAAKRRRE